MKPSTSFVRKISFLPLYLVLNLVAILDSNNCMGQVTPFKKSVLDSLEDDDFHLSLAITFNSSQDGETTLTASSDIAAMYSTQKSNYQILQSSYFNRITGNLSANRFFAMGIASLYNHTSKGEKITENSFYPEPFVVYSFDANKGLNYRWQFGIDGDYGFKPTKVARIKVGIGVLYELENWQIIQADQLSNIYSLPPPLQKYIFDTIGVDSKGCLFRNNFRANFFANMMFKVTSGVNLNIFFNLQEPFVPPYYNLPNTTFYPVDTKRYPRITIDTELLIQLWGRLSFVSTFYLQWDKGQIPLYVPNFIYNLAEGIQFDL
jgi:hypothetical protein